jgi:hypothetical protein
MLQVNSDLIMRRLQPGDVVLDIGGWAHPFNRADFIMDLEPYETRGYYNRAFARSNPIPAIGGTAEHFSAATWIQRDICDRAPFPFANKSIDFVICSHTLEDIRDPLWVCSEMTRIGKAGYIEVPSRLWESCRGMERGIAGLSHHRWLIEIEDTKIAFMQKYHSIHSWRRSLPHSVLKNTQEQDAVQWMFWKAQFDFAEVVLHGDAQTANLESFVAQIKPHPRWLLRADDMAQRMLARASRILAGFQRRSAGGTL